VLLRSFGWLTPSSIRKKWSRSERFPLRSKPL